LDVVGRMLDEAEAIDSEEYDDASYIFVQLGPPVVSLLVDALADPQRSGAAKEIATAALADEELRKHLGEHGPRLVDLLTVGLKDSDWGYRREAARSLGQLGGLARPSIPALREALLDGEVSEFAAFALARLGQGASGLDALAEALRHEDADQRREAVRAL